MSPDHDRQEIKRRWTKHELTAWIGYDEQANELYRIDQSDPTVQKLYFVQDERGPIKVGIAKNMKSRLQGIQNGNPYPVRLLYLSEGDGREAEQWILRAFEPSRLNGEWFRPTAQILRMIHHLRMVRPGSDHLDALSAFVHTGTM